MLCKCSGKYIDIYFNLKITFHLEDDDDDEDKERLADPPVLDKTYAKLVEFIYNRFAHSRPSASAQLPPQCEFEEFFAVSDPPSASRQNLMVYPRVSEIINSSAERASRLAKESRPIYSVVPLRRKMFFVGDKPDFCNAQFVNPDFSRISKNKTIIKSRTSSVALADLERIERGSRTILVGDSQCYWLLSSLLAQLKDDGYRPSDPALFDKNISSLSAALASQTMMASGVTDFVSSKCCESYLAHAACPIAESVKRDLLVAPGTESFLFDQPLLEKVVSQMKEDSLLSSTASLASLSKAASRGRSRSLGSERYSSPLDQPRSSSSGSRKRPASPVCCSFVKRGPVWQKWSKLVAGANGARQLARGSGVSASSPRGVRGSAREANVFIKHKCNFMELSQPQSFNCQKPTPNH